MRATRLIGVLGTATLVVTLAAAAPAPPDVGSAARSKATTVQVDWPSEPLTWNVVAWVTATVQPARAGRVVRLSLWGMGGPGWSRIDTGRTDSAGRVRLRLLTMCVDGDCTEATDRYRVIVLPTSTMSGAMSKGTIALQW